MGKVDVNKQQKESSLLKTAFEFFTTKGFSKTSISDIAGKAGAYSDAVSPASYS